MLRNRLRYFTTVRLVNAVQGKGGNKSQSKVLFYVKDFQSRTSSTSSLGSIYHPPDCATENETLSKLIRNGISSHDIEESGTHKTDTGMSLCFLGTAAGLPSLRRSTSATLLRMGGSSFLFDAGEGVQRQLMFTRAKPSHIERIFVTHLHGDHIYGLPGLILGLQRSISALKDDPRKKNSKKKKALEDHKVKIYGPPGLYNYIASNIVLSCTKLHSISIEVHELVGGRVRRTHGGRDMRNPFEASYPEFNYGCLVRKKIECENGVWNIEDVPRITRDEIMKSNLRNESRGVRIKAAEVDHLSGVATFGFVVEEDEPARNIDPVKAQELGVSPQGKKYSLLKYGFSVLTDDGETEVHSNEVLKPRTKSARKVTIVGDNRGWTSEMAAIAKNSDVLIHEATLLEEDSSRGHSTAHMAGRISGKIDAKVLVLNHISSRYDKKIERDSFRQTLAQDAKDGSGGKSDILVSYDFMELLLPWLGFRNRDGEEESESYKRKTAGVEASNPGQVMEKWFGGSN